MAHTPKFLSTIGLDIDGTITDDQRELPDEVALFLENLYKQGFCFVFITGREFVYAMQILGKLNFPFYLGVQNGADLLKMPERKHLKSFYLDKKIVLELEKLFVSMSEDLFVYAGYERGDFCYYKPEKQSEKMIPYIKRMQKRCPVNWQAVHSFKECNQQDFSLIKAIGKERSFLDLEAKFKSRPFVEYVVIKDPISEVMDYLLVTDKKASKQQALEYFMTTYQLPRPLIVAGDDYNDKGALEYADIKIVMENAPLPLKSLATILAPLSKNKGIIEGLTKAIALLQL